MTGRTLVVAQIGTPLGTMLAAVSGDALVLLEFADGARARRQLGRVERRLGLVATDGWDPIFDQAERELGEAFAGRRRAFGVAIHPFGTPFQARCWAWIREIPCGETRSYAEAATALGTSPRAFGHANAANPLAIIVPCHRVIASDGGLSGYGGGLHRKRALLDLERAAAPDPASGIATLMTGGSATRTLGPADR